MDIRAKEQYPDFPPFDIVINNAGVQNEEDIDVKSEGNYWYYRKVREFIQVSVCSIDDRFCQRPSTGQNFLNT